MQSRESHWANIKIKPAGMSGQSYVRSEVFYRDQRYSNFDQTDKQTTQCKLCSALLVLAVTIGCRRQRVSVVVWVAVDHFVVRS